MRLLLDAHTLLWWLAASPRLSEPARDAIAKGGNEIAVSAAALWEIGIKRALGRLEAPASPLDVLTAQGFSVLAISGGHAVAAAELPALHGDPFDRMLVAQARAEGMCLVTTDPVLARYGVPTLW